MYCPLIKGDFFEAFIRENVGKSMPRLDKADRQSI